MGTSKWRGAALAVCLAILSTAGQAQTDPARPDHGTASAATSAGPKLRVRTVEVRDVNLGSQATVAVSIGRIAFIGFSRDGDRIHADQVDIEGLIARIGPRAIEIPTISMTGFEGPTEAFLAITEGRDIDHDGGTLLQQASADQISIERILDRDPSASSETVLEGLLLTSVRNGLVRMARFAGAEIRSNSPSPANRGIIRLGQGRYHGINVAEMMLHFSGGGGGDRKTLIERAVISGMEMITSESTVRVDRLELVRVEGRALAQRLPVDELHAAQTGPIENPESRRHILNYLSEVVHNTRIARYSLEGVAISTPQQGTATFGAITFGGFDASGLDLFEIRAVDVATPDGSMHLGRLVIDKIAYGALVDVMFGAAVADKPPDLGPAKLIEVSPRIAAIRLESIKVDTQQGTVALDGFEVELDDRIAAIPENFRIALKGLSVDLARWLEGEARDKLVALGDTELRADGRLQLRWLPTAKLLVADDTELLIDRVGRVDLSVRLGNVNFAPLADPHAATRTLEAAQLGSIEVRLENLGFAERYYAQVANDSGRSPDAVRDDVAAKALSQVTATFGPSLAAGSADALARFLKMPGKLAVRIAPRPNQPAPTVAELERLDLPQLAEHLTITLESGGN